MAYQRKPLLTWIMSFPIVIRMSKIIAVAKFSNGTMNLPKEVKELLSITETKGKIAFIEENGKICIQKA